MLNKESVYISGPVTIKEILVVVYKIGGKSNTYFNYERSRRFAEINGKINISDWLVKAGIGFGIFKDIKGRGKEVLLTKKGLKIYENILKSKSIVSYLESVYLSIKENQSAAIKDDEDTFEILSENSEVIENIIECIDSSIIAGILKEFFKYKNDKILNKLIKSEMWEFVNKAEIKTDSKTANAYDNRVVPIIKIASWAGMIEKIGEYYIYKLKEDEINLPKNEDNKIDDNDKIVDGKRKVRGGQRAFRTNLIKKHNSCVVCDISQEVLLKAAHIKKYSLCLTDEKYDLENGLIFCANHDLLFEYGFIYFDDELVLRSNGLTEAQIMKYEITNIKITGGKKRREFLKFHRKNLNIE